MTLIIASRHGQYYILAVLKERTTARRVLEARGFVEEVARDYSVVWRSGENRAIVVSADI